MKSKTLGHGSTTNRRRSGIAIVYLAVVLIGILGLIGLACDTAYVLMTGHELQNAADAAALAGADEVAFDTAQAKTNAISWAAGNQAAGSTSSHQSVKLDPTSDVQVGTFNRATATFTINGSPANAVMVTARRTSTSPDGALPLIFGQIVNITTANVTRSAIAMTRPLSAGLIVLNRTANPAIQFTGTGSNPTKINIPNGGVVVDSSNDQAIQWTGQPTIAANTLAIVGNDTAVQTGGVYPSGSLTLQAPYVADPLASLPAPAQPAISGVFQNGAWQPGYYAASNPITGGKLAPGIYWVDGGINLGKGNQSIDASAGCLIFLHTGGISITGNQTIIINPMTTGAYAGISFYEDRTNSSPVTLQGTSGATSTGRFYFPSAPVTIQGTPNSFATQVICDTLAIGGNAQLNINYDHSLDVQQHESFLAK
ncbi:MAG: hypothetical protein JWL69_4476 [Phycisphaerales bacterium]|nr:hypothetical protein [Phycisphaerales bacterium]